jgi:hypothetical protein
MFARLVSFNFGPGQHQTAEALAADLGPLIRSQPGCSSVSFFGDDMDGEYGIFVLWDTQAQAEAAAALVSPRLEQHLAGKVKGKPSRRLFEVIGTR